MSLKGYHPDEVLAKLEKVIKQYDLYAYLSEEQHKTIFLTDIEDMGFSKIQFRWTYQKGYVEKI